MNFKIEEGKINSDQRPPPLRVFVHAPSNTLVNVHALNKISESEFDGHSRDCLVFTVYSVKRK